MSTDAALIPGGFDRRAVARAVGALDPQSDAAHAPTWAESLDIAADALARAADVPHVTRWQGIALEWAPGP